MSFTICTIGCGSHASAVHGPSYQKYKRLHADVRLAACCDVNEQAAANYRNTFGFERYYTDLDRMLDAEKPDAVGLVVPVELTAHDDRSRNPFSTLTVIFESASSTRSAGA